MANLDQTIEFTKLYQDVELATAIGELKKNPAKLQQFLQSQQDKVFKDVVTQKNSTFNKVYGDLNRASKAQEAMLMHQKRNSELLDVSNKILDNQSKSASAVLDDKNTAGRKFEMNEWSVNNKKDTLFVFSMLFIMLSGLVLITVLWRMGIISSYFGGMLSLPLILIFIFTVVYRSQYTDVYRNKRYWNRKIFEGKYGKIPVPLCPGAIESVQSGVQSIRGGVQSGISSAGRGVAGVAQGLAQGSNMVAQGISDSIVQNVAPVQ
jgi:hypothetical protein